MSFKPALLIALATISLSASAQDKIFMNSGKVIEAKVSKVSNREVVYKKYNDPTGPNQVISRKMVAGITYENGTEEPGSRTHRGPVRLRKEAKPVTPESYRNNIVSISPSSVGIEGFGLGIAYERMFGKQSKFSVFVPVTIYLRGFGHTDNDAEPIATLDIYNKRERIIQIDPGVRFYPTGNKGTIRYAVGLSLDYESGYTIEGGWSGTRENRIYTPEDNVRMQKMGVLLNNSINVFPTPHFFIGLDVGLGYIASSRREYTYTNTMYGLGSQGLLQGSVRLGYRF